MKEENKDLEKALAGLLEKYHIKQPGSFSLSVSKGENTLEMKPGFVFDDTLLKTNQVPLLTWRVKRKFVELKKIVEDSVIENVCLFRFCCLGDKDNWSLSSLLYREMDLFEFIGNGKIISVQAVFTDEQVGNVILHLDNNALCSIEVGIQMPSGSTLVERHEIIARRGVASDLVVDTQVSQSSIYSYTKDGEKRFTDVDMELFGYDESEIDHIRSAFQIFKTPQLAEQWIQQHSHLTNLVRMAFESDRKRERITKN
jgi:hypothetical protein